MRLWVVVTLVALGATLVFCADPSAFMRGWDRGTCLGSKGAYCPHE